MKKSRFASLAVAMLALLLVGRAAATCSGQFYNPVTDVCWSCIFPITIAGQTFAQGQIDLAPKIKPSAMKSCDPFGVTCRCGDRCGLPLSFYEPARHYDMTKTPGCFPGLGMEVDLSGLPAGGRGEDTRTELSARRRTFNHINVYVDPVLYWLGVLPDFPCLEQKGFDLLYSTPADICWSDEAACAFLNPEAFLFGNLAGVMACSADCVVQTAAQYRSELTDTERAAIDATYWCVGCNNSGLPLSGYVEYSPGREISDTQTLGQRMFQKLHRELLVWGTSGVDGLCGYYPKPLMAKTDYRNQMLFPIPETEKLAGRCCQSFGVTTSVWGSGKTFPIKGEDFSFMVFRKRDCCLGSMRLDQF